MSTRVLLLLPLMSIILISGCTIPGFNGGTTGESNVIIIETLRAIPDTLTSTATPQTITLFAVVKNQGGAAVPQSIFTDSFIEVQLYDYCSGVFKLPATDSGVTCLNGHVKKSSPQAPGFDICQISLLSVNERRYVQWRLSQEPQIQVEVDCTMKVMASYPYSTTSLTTIHFIESSELQRQIAEGTYQEKQSAISKGDGPVKAWFEVVGDQPIPVDYNIEGQEMTLALHIENMGTGILVGNDVIITGMTIAKLADENEITLKDCDEIDLTNEPTTGPKTVELVQDTYEKICSAQLSQQLTKIPKEITVHATVTIEYNYQITKETEVKVEPTAV